MKIADFTVPELDYFRENCNFTKTERTFFELRAQELTLEEIAGKIHASLSTVKRLNSKVKSKIIRVV